MKANKVSLIDIPPDWRRIWHGMPEFIQNDEHPYATAQIRFKTMEDRVSFFALFGQNPARRRALWWPETPPVKKMGSQNKVPVKTELNEHPVYIISKGRWETRYTVRALDALSIPYHIVIEPQEYDRYATVIPAKKIYVLPFSNLGQGGIPARNWVWDHAITAGAAWHWILDDNIDGFYQLNQNRKRIVTESNPLIPLERIVAQYENIGIAGLNYDYFAVAWSELPPYYLNTRIYSCILINNTIPFRWRGRYNEDTDLSLRVLKAGWCTFLLNTVLAKKKPTLTTSGGNTDELYQGDGRLKMAESLREQHPDVTRVVWKWGRWQHSVNYRKFKLNKLVAKKEVRR